MFCQCTPFYHGNDSWCLMQGGARPDPEQHKDVGSSLYENAKLLSNREAAAECISRAEEALAEADFDKAVRICLEPISNAEMPLGWREGLHAEMFGLAG